MDRQHKVLFYGNSLLLAGVQATLKGFPDFEIIASDQPTTQAELLGLNPTVVIFDMLALESEFFLAQMQALPGLLLIGVDPESHEVLLTGQAVCSLSLEQIARIVPHLVGSSIPPPSQGA